MVAFSCNRHLAGTDLIEYAFVGSSGIGEYAVEGEVPVCLEAVSHVPCVASVDCRLVGEVGDGLEQLAFAGELTDGEGFGYVGNATTVAQVECAFGYAGCAVER